MYDVISQGQERNHCHQGSRHASAACAAPRWSGGPAVLLRSMSSTCYVKSRLHGRGLREWQLHTQAV